MKRIYIYLSIATTLLISSCGKDWLKVVPTDTMTGNNYWQTEEDIKMFIGGLYSNFRIATMNQSFFPSTGDLRAAPIIRNAGSNASYDDFNWLDYIRDNNLDAIFSYYSNANKRDWGYKNDFFGFHQIKNWKSFYKVIGAANIAQYELSKLEDGIISEQKKRQYIAEAVFMRNLSYFFLVRLFGDVAYYTDAYYSESLVRTPMLEVLQKVDADVAEHYKDLPWTQTNVTEVGNRPMRGSALALMMHVNMWLAGFSESNKTEYYTRTTVLGKELIEENTGAYDLLPLSRTKEIFKGRTKEGLFEITQNFNYGELFHLSAMYADNFLRYPYKRPEIVNSYLHYSSNFMLMMYPLGQPDNRKSVWFEEQNLYQPNGRFVFLKTLNVFRAEGEDTNPDDNFIVFRYADAILLRAEALAELGGGANEQEAISLVNRIRNRAGATPISALTGENLKDFIWWERVRELLGEGHFYYDLVRTKKILSGSYCIPISIDAFYKGAWTWPIDQSALNNNPYMTLNTYWSSK
ncbi:RagB/SusD family nutrient uptake outer membrane protein [Sphingobacterium bovistauri]|uniref:RagB/SusD family nutrient uptake outer membrane protein n=1 Tax=Sphingobacterium bovistauri TaxID=2781959 RepID=A0ABS7Z7E8_9SPHI|nr:RagB/SusD family nutrient uptake outer membrane protein [Sphingobacterium bovistauri]MCA5005913.1 RagB/SusD family nutrient uptake outer membrane protein [Sphingobacterium bovistauri]